MKQTLRNFGPFRGEHELLLGPGVHAIVARREDDPSSSNWAGKSTVAWATPFANYGVKMPAWRTEDDWVTKGEPDGYVQNEYSCGLVVKRSRVVGSATRLAVTTASGATLTGDEAEKAIQEAVGMTREDYFATCYFGQKKLSHLVTCKAADRMEIVSGWFRLGALEDCYGILQRDFDVVAKNREELSASIQGNAARLADVAAEAGFPADDGATLDYIGIVNAHVTKEEALLAGEIALVEEQSIALTSELDRLLVWRKAHSDAAECARVVEEGKSLAATVTKEIVASLVEKKKQASAAVHACAKDCADAEREKKDAAKLAAGRFDGVCPLAGIQCPATAEINAPREQNAARLKAAEEVWAEARTKLNIASAIETDDARKLREAEQRMAKLLDLRARRDALYPQVTYIREHGDPPALAELQQKTRETTEELTRLKGRLNSIGVASGKACALAAAIKLSRKEHAAQEQQADRIRRAMAVFGRHGAQRVVAERGLAAIVRGANGLLSAGGIALSIDAAWAREADGLAAACDACGYAFPATQKVKSCARCGAARGPKLVQKLELNLSDRSGAAEDLGGMAFQLAAAAWLRADRESAWSVATIDEPLGALDEANRRAFLPVLSTMLSGEYGFAQSFVIAHHPGAMDALPHRIEIVAGSTKGSSRVRVVS